MSNKPRNPVLVVSAPSSFPDFSKFGVSVSKNKEKKDNHRDNKLTGFDFNGAAREVHTLGSTQFVGLQKKKFDVEQYKAITGREKKKQKVPIKIVRAIKKAAAKKEARVVTQLKEAGVVTANKRKCRKKTYSEQNRRNMRIHGPAPTAGFMSRGVLRVKK
jgi:hypothetical protein